MCYQQKKKKQERDKEKERGAKICLRLWLAFIDWNKNERAYWTGLINKFLFKLKVNPFILILNSSYKKLLFPWKKKGKIVLFYLFYWNNINICICPHGRYRSIFSDYSKYGRTFKRLSANGHLLTFQIPFCDLNPGRIICRNIRKPFRELMEMCRCACSVAHSCLTVWDPMDCSLPGSSVHEILSRYEYWDGLPFLPPGDLPDPEVKSVSPEAPALDSRFLTTKPIGKP